MREKARLESAEERPDSVVPLTVAIARLALLADDHPANLNQACHAVLEDFTSAYSADRRQRISSSLSLMLAMQRRLPHGPVQKTATALLTNQMQADRRC